MPDPKLVLPYDVEGVLVDTLDRAHAEHLAKMERQREDPPRTYEPFKTVVRMADAGADRLTGDIVPALLLGVIGAPDLTVSETNTVDATFQLGVQVTVIGTHRRDTLLRRDVMAWTAAECLLTRTPRGDGALIDSIRMTDYEPLAEVDTQRTVGDARMVFEVGVTNVISLTGFLPALDREWPAEAGGQPPDPYTPPEPLPQADIQPAQYERRPIVE